jgi:hypothetical protein
MKLSIVFCVLALAAAADDAVADGSHLVDSTEEYKVCGNPDSPQTEVIEYKFDSANNWVGDHGAKADRSANFKVTTTYRGGAKVVEIGHREQMTKTTTWTVRKCSGFKKHSRCDTGCSRRRSYRWRGRTYYYSGQWCKDIRGRRYRWERCSLKCHWETHSKDTDYLAGYCNIASYNGESMWVVAGSAANNQFAAGKKDWKSGDDAHYCDLSTVATYTKPKQECQLSYYVDTWGQLEENDVTCVTAFAASNEDVITRECMSGKEIQGDKDPTHTVTSDWFSGDTEFKIALSAITQGTYFNGHEIIAHDDVKLTCRPCATPAPTNAPTNAPTVHPCDDGTHGCDPEHGVCTPAGGNGWTCACKTGYECMKGCEANAVDHWCEKPKTVIKTRAPTKPPTREPTKAACDVCRYTKYSEWTKCSVDCGEGVQTRTRTVLFPVTAKYSACQPFTCKLGDEGDADVDTRKCHASFCDQECEMGEWSEWSHPDSKTPENVMNIWNETVHGSNLHVHRTRSIVMQPTGKNKACPASIEYKPWIDHCNAKMGREKNERICDLDVCKNDDDVTTCHHNAERCAHHAFTRVNVKYTKKHRCGDVGY